MTTPNKIYATVLNGHVTMAWSDWREDKTDIEYVRADIHEAQMEALKAENAALHAECDRLTAMLGPQRVLEAEDVTQPGFYWHRYGTEELCVVDVDYGYPYGQMFIWVNGEQEEHALEGQFIGPIRMPEVSNA